MKLTLACVGTRMPDWVEKGWQEYARRMPPHLPLELVEIQPAGKAGGSRPSDLEGERLLARLPDDAHCIALAIDGQQWPTEKLAVRLQDWQMNGAPVWLMVGGAEGLADSVLQRCRERWSLGPATLPHMLVRIIVAEQLYRAWTILDGHPYHRV